MAMEDCVIGAALEVVESIRSQLPEWKSSRLWQLKVQLGLLRTFYMCGRKWGKGVEDCESTLLKIVDDVHKHSRNIQSISLRLREDDGDDRVKSGTRKWDNLHKGVSKFLDCIRRSFRQEMLELYEIFSSRKLQPSFSSREVELFVGIMDSLLDNWEDILQYHEDSNDYQFTERLELQGHLRFLKDFIRLAMFQGHRRTQMKGLLTRTEDLVIYVAHETFLLWNDGSDDFIGDLKNSILPSESHVCELYVGVLQKTSKISSHHPSPGSHILILRDFVDSLLQLICSLIYSFDEGCIFDDSMQKLYGALRSLRSILRQHQSNFDEPYEKIHDLIQAVICDAGIIFCYIIARNGAGGLVEKLKLQFLGAEENLRLIREAEEAMEKYPLIPANNFPQTNLLGFIDSVLEKTKSVLLSEADSVASTKDQFQTILDDLVFLRSFPADVEEQNRKEELQGLHNRVAAVAYKTEFVLDSLIVADASQISGMLLNTIPEEIKIIKAEAIEIFQRKKLIIKGPKTYSKMSLAVEIPVSDEPLVGLGDELQKIIDRLERGTRESDIVSIVGMPGLGKTTLAKKVYENPSIIRHFHVRSWCCVSQDYKTKRMLLDILSGLSEKFANKHSEMNEDDLAQELYRHLKGKRYLILLDDVWDTAAWNSLRISFPNDTNGSRILLTSRYFDVALQIKQHSEPHQLRFLTIHESWELMQKKIHFEESCPSILLARGKAIAENCKGLPLMILIVCGLLPDMDPDTWEGVAESLRISTLPILEQCRETLELSYLHLPAHLKSCFLYFGAFQEDQQIHVRKLFNLWIAEGFVQKTEGKCLEDIANGYMMQLIQRSLVMVGKRGSRGFVKSCILHDLLLDFCKEKSKEEHFLYCLHGYELGTSIEPSELYRLRVDTCCEENYEDSQVFCPYLRTLFFSSDDDVQNDGQHWDLENDGQHWYDILYNFFRSRHLRVLDVRLWSRWSSTLAFFPRETKLLVHLKYLALSFGEGIVSELHIPSSIENLVNLETFIVLGGAFFDVLLPDTVLTMKKLRCLCGSFDQLYPKGNLEYCPSLENLETLSNTRFSCFKTMTEVLRKFPNISKLKCKFRPEKDHTGDCCTILSLDFISQLESLTISGRIGECRIQFSTNLKKLVLSEFELPWNKISAVVLPSLEVLKLRWRAFEGKNWDVEEEQFPKLKFLQLEDLDLVSWIAPDDSFPVLEKLVLNRCENLEEVPLCLAYCSTLQTIEVCDCESATASIDQIGEEIKSFGNDYLKICILPSRRNKQH